MSVETVKTYLKSFGRDEDIQEFPVSSATVELAAAALSVEPARIAKTLPAGDVLRLTGHAVGGVCPFALPEGVRVTLDMSLRRFPLVYPACGSANSAIGLTCEELEAYSRDAVWVDVCKDRAPA